MTKVFAHRGAHQNERENTIGAFAAAVALGVDGVELDVRRTLDGVLVVQHDPAIGELVLARSEFRDLPAHVATLEAALVALRGTSVNVEIKKLEPDASTDEATGDLAHAVVSLVTSLGRRDDVIISSFDLATCAVVRSIDHAMRVAWLFWDRDLSRAMVEAHALTLNAVNPHFFLIGEGTVSEAKRLSLEVNAWTVNSETDLEAMARLGVASVITDEPAAAMAVLRHHGRPSSTMP